MQSPRPIIIALAAAAVTLAVAEAGARWVKSRNPVIHSYEAARNPHFRRDWVRFTAPRPRPAGTRLVIAIGNSQGFLREEQDGELAWPRRLAVRLNDEGSAPAVIVANWSVPAGNASEMILLAARAAAHRPDLVIVSFGANTFISPRAFERPLTFWLSDATALAYVPSVRGLLSRDFLVRTRAYDLPHALRAWSAIAWLRTRHLDEPRGTWSWVIQKYRRVRRFPVHGPSIEAAEVQLRELASALYSRSSGSRLLLAQMPVAPTSLTALGREKAKTTEQVAAEVFSDDPRIRVVSALDLLGDERFHTATHLDAQGHEAYAAWLAPVARSMLELD